MASNTDRFDIVPRRQIRKVPTLNGAQIQDDAPETVCQNPGLNLRLHFEKKEATIYVLTVQSSGGETHPSQKNATPTSLDHGGIQTRHA